MDDTVEREERRRDRLAGPLSGLVIGAAGGSLLSAFTSQGYLHAAVVTGAGYTGQATELDPLGQLAMVIAWLSLGAFAGFVGRTGGAFVGLWLGALAGSAVGILNDPAGNILWLDLVVTVVGISLFLAPGFFLGSAIGASRERHAPDGSGRRPAPPPLWTRGVRTIRRSQPTAVRSMPGVESQTAASWPASAYARPGSHPPE